VQVAQLQFSSIGSKSFLYEEFLILIFPDFVLINADPCLAKRVGATQSNVSIPHFTKLQISEGSPMPNK